MSERFHIADLLTTVTGRLLGDMDGLYRVCDVVTGVSHMTHQLPRASEVVAPWLLEQHPWLADVTVPDDLSGELPVRAFVAGLAAQHGEWHEVEPMPFGMYVGRDPMAELREMAPHAEVFEVPVPPT